MILKMPPPGYRTVGAVIGRVPATCYWRGRQPGGRQVRLALLLNCLNRWRQAVAGLSTKQQPELARASQQERIPRIHQRFEHRAVGEDREAHDSLRITAWPKSFSRRRTRKQRSSRPPLPGSAPSTRSISSYQTLMDGPITRPSWH